MVTDSLTRRSPMDRFVRVWWPWVSIPVRLLVGGVWIAAGALKLQDIDDSVRSVRNFQILPEFMVQTVGTGLPVFEIVIGALLVVGLGIRVSAGLSALLQLAFIIGISSAWARGLQIECGCFGGSGTLVQNASAKYPWEIARDFGLLILSVLLVIWGPEAGWRSTTYCFPRSTKKDEDPLMVKSNKRRDEERRAAAAAKVAEMQRAQRAAERRRRSISVSAAAIGVVVVIVGIFIVVQNQHKAPHVAAAGVGGSTADYGFVVGKADAPATMIAYEDFQCPVCKSFEVSDGATIQKYITAGKLKVEFRPIAILDRESSTDYSTRSLNAAACVRNFSTAQAFKTYHDLLYAHQPSEGSAGLPDSDLVTYANQAIGSTKPAVATCINDETYKNWTSSATDAASKAGVSGTPTVKLNGQDIDINTLAVAADFKKALDAAVASGSKKN